MDESLDERINRLREKTRAFLTQVNENSKRVKEEFGKLYSQNLSSSRNCENHIDEPRLIYKGNIKSWKLRNDSTGVSGALCSDCFCTSPKQTFTSMPNIQTTKRVLTSLKKHSENQCCLQYVNRRPVKDCYCNLSPRKVKVRSGRTQHKQHSPCKHFKSHTYTSARTVEDNEKLLTSPISCETLRRVEKIDYPPRSQFLRNVQSKASLLQATTAKGDCPDTCSRSQCYHELMSERSALNGDSIHHIRADDEKSKTCNYLTKSESTSKIVKNSEASKHKSSEFENIDKSCKGVFPEKHTKPIVVVKRTLSSNKSVPDLKKLNSKTLIEGKRISRNNFLSCSNKFQYPKIVIEQDNYCASGDYRPTVCKNKNLEEINKGHLSDEEVRELRKFREQNYFDTHGSNQTLISSKSSGSLKQYLLNDRLFPESVGCIHKKDLVVTMPPCATVQRKRIHYFPRFIVRQEKNSTNYKKKRCQSCPLTGHAIDLGITKIRPPLNSLALKYQKRLP